MPRAKRGVPKRLVLPCLGALAFLCALARSREVASAPPEAPQILRFVEGVDAAPVPLAEADISQLNDPWAMLVLRKNIFPTDLTHALAALDPPKGEAGFSAQESFFVSESGQLPVNVMLVREFRMVITRGQPTDSLPPVLISSPAGQRAGFIELISWDSTKKAFNFYRRPKGDQWIWKGDSRDAFRTTTAGKGCFQCHRHGMPIMKEMRAPWNNWQSQVASIPPEAIPSVEIRDSLLFKNRSDARELELVVRGWESQVATELVKSLMKRAKIDDAPLILRSLFVTDTINLQSSQQRSNGLSQKVDIPLGFFLNDNAFSNVLGLETLPQFSGNVDRVFYSNSLQKFAFKLSDGEQFTQKGDTHFGFLVPVTAESSTALLRQAITQHVISRHFALSVLLVDFPNPVYSQSRGSLLKYVPATGSVQDGMSDLAERTAQAIVTAAPNTPMGSPERQFVDNWNAGPDQLRTDAEKRIKDYQTAVLTRLKTQDGVNDYTRLAEARRQRFASTALNEFPLLLPQTNLPAHLDLRMNQDGSVSR
jgi:hypothetical protein